MLRIKKEKKKKKNQEGETWKSTNRENDLKNVGSSVQWIQPLQIIWSGILLPANIEKRPDYPSTETTTTTTKSSPDKLHKTTVSKTLYTRQQMTAIPERWETNEGSPNIAPRFLPWESFQSLAQGGETEWELRDFPESRTQELRLEELEPTGQNTRQKRSTQRTLEICSKCLQIFSRMSLWQV